MIQFRLLGPAAAIALLLIKRKKGFKTKDCELDIG